MVNCLLHAVAQNMIYIDTAKQAEFLYNHKPNIMFTEPKEMRQLEGMTLKEQEEFLQYQVKLANNCQLRGTTEQEKLPKIIHKLSVHIIETLDEPYRSYAIEGVIGGLFEEGVMKEGKFQSILSLVILGSKIDDFTFSQIKEKHGTGVELQITFLMAKTFPFLFTDDLACALKSSVKELVGTAVEKLKKLGGWIINKLEQIGAQVKQFTHEFGEAMCKFIAGAKNAWGKLKAYINGLVDDIINTGKAAVIEVENCIHRVTTAVSNFFTSMANGIKRFIVLFGKDGAIRKGIVNTWHTIKDTVTQSVNTIINETRVQLNKQYQVFKEGMNYLVNYTKQTLTKLGDKGFAALRSFRNRVVQGLVLYTTTRLNVDLIRLAELQYKMRKLERYFGERVYQILNEAERVTSDVRRSYSEYYVQQQICALEITCDQIRDSGRRVCDALQRKTAALQDALAHYKQIETSLCININS